MSEHFHDGVCNCNFSNASQSLDEIEFERGIWTAALYNDIDRLQSLIKRGEINRPDNFGYTALHYAVRKNNIEVCKLLIKCGANVDAITNSGATALHRAAMMGHNEIIKLLLNSEVNLMVQDNDGNSALHRAAQNMHLETVKILLNHKNDLKYIVNNNDQSPYDLVPSDCTELRSILQH